MKKGMHHLATNMSSNPLEGLARMIERGGALVGKHPQMTSLEDCTTGFASDQGVLPSSEEGVR